MNHFIAPVADDDLARLIGQLVALEHELTQATADEHAAAVLEIRRIRLHVAQLRAALFARQVIARQGAA